MAKRSLRIEYGKYLVECGAKYGRIVVLEADLKESTQSCQFERAYPARFIEIGIAEQNLVGIAAGLALAHKIPMVHSFACFISMRACEQVRTTISYPRLNVKFIASHAGISAGTAGTTHHSIEDIAIMRSIPNMTVVVPGDAREMRQAVKAAIEHDGPVYIRLSAAETEDIFDNSYKFRMGKAARLRRGGDATIISTGTLMYEAILASDLLAKDFGIRAEVFQMASIKPLDTECVLRAAERTGNIVTIEDHSIIGGLGSAVSEVVAEKGKARVRRIGIRDHFCGVGTYAGLKEKEGLDVNNIVKTLRNLLKHK